jgi:hypothetical protein
MKNTLVNFWFLMLALAVVSLKAVGWLVMLPIFLGARLYELIRYEAQCLRNPPPPGGVFGAMARSQREKSRGSKSSTR